MSPQCQSCDAHVSERFARVCGDNDGTVHACLECENKAVVKYQANGRERPHSHSGGQA